MPEEAAECERRALLALEDTARSTFADLATQWRFLATQADMLVKAAAGGLAQEKSP